MNERPIKKLCIMNSSTNFIFSKDSLDNYEKSNPQILIIINSSFSFSHYFLNKLFEGNTKTNVNKIITSDSVVVRYINVMVRHFADLFPNCKTIQVNSFENNFESIFEIIDSIKCVTNIEFNITDSVVESNEFYKYKNFFDILCAKNFHNIKSICIRNKITNHPKFRNIFNVLDVKNKINYATNIRYEELKKNNKHSHNFELFELFELLCKFPNQTNITNIRYIDCVGNVIVNENLLCLINK